MSYEVTATRRRPQAFEALAGQEFVAETLKNAIQSQKIAHAYLFSAPVAAVRHQPHESSQKHSTARTVLLLPRADSASSVLKSQRAQAQT